MRGEFIRTAGHSSHFPSTGHIPRSTAYSLTPLFTRCMELIRSMISKASTGRNVSLGKRKHYYQRPISPMLYSLGTLLVVFTASLFISIAIINRFNEANNSNELNTVQFNKESLLFSGTECVEPSQEDKGVLILDDFQGRFGNALLQFKNAAIMARILGRTLVSTTNFKTRQGVNIFDVFDVNSLRQAGYRIDYDPNNFTVSKAYRNQRPLQVFDGMNMEELKDQNDKVNDRVLTVDKAQAHMMCPHPLHEVHFHQSLRPTRDYLEMSESIARKILARASTSSPYLVGIHLRGFEGDCLHRAKAVLAVTSFAQGSRMCKSDWSMVKEILEEHFIDESKVVLYVSSDGQQPALLDTFKGLPLVKTTFAEEFEKECEHLFKPAIDMLILSKSHLFIGNAMSTFSTHVSNWRSSEVTGRSGPNVLSWPRLENDASIQSYWQCFHSNYWCDTTGAAPRC